MGQRKMVRLGIGETSGVDHPAHLSEGWVVMKAAGQDETDAVIAAALSKAQDTGKGGDMTDAEKIAALETQVQALTKAVETATEAMEKAAKPATEEAPVEKAAEGSLEEMLKSVPEPVRKALEAAQAQATEAVQKATAATTALTTVMEKSADEQSVAKARDEFAHLSLDPAVVGPALRRLEATSPDLAKAVGDALKAADGQVESADIFASMGHGGGAQSPTSGLEKATVMAKALVEKGAAPTVEQALAQVLESNPDLYNAHLMEQGK